MSGLVKAKKYDWKDSNMALFGSDTEKKVFRYQILFGGLTTVATHASA